MLIKDFREKKVTDYLDSGNYKTALIIFHHGLGDLIQFHGCCYIPLVARYAGKIDIELSLQRDQQDFIFDKDTDPSHYDIAFEIKYSCTEWGTEPITKAQRCARDELGIDFKKEAYYLTTGSRPSLVGLHMFSTCNPKMNCPEDISKKLWEQIQEAGFIPIETHMVHFNANRFRPYAHETQNIVSEKATIPKLFGLIKSCAGFAGVSSGNFWAALASLFPQYILFLRTDFSVKRMTSLPVWEMDVRRGYDDILVADWLDTIRG